MREGGVEGGEGEKRREERRGGRGRGGIDGEEGERREERREGRGR